MTDPDCVFCEIITGSRVANIVLDDDEVVAFLDIRPLFWGHTLVVPRLHHETLADLPPAAIEPYFARVQRLTTAVQSATDSVGSFVAMNNIVSQSVPHLHTHVVPRNRKDGLRGFFWPRTKYDDDAHAARTAAAIAAKL